MCKKKNRNIRNNIRMLKEKHDYLRSQPSWFDHEGSKLEVDPERMLAIEEDY